MKDAFISYERRFPVHADVIAECLTQNGFTYWRDVSDIRSGEAWKREIDQGLEQSTVLIVLITNGAAKSSGMKYEIDKAKELNMRCIPIIMEKMKNFSVPLMKMQLGDIEVIDFVSLGLVAGRSDLAACMRRLTDEWAPIQANIDNLKHFSSVVRLNAIRELGDTHDERVLPYLFEALKVETEQSLIREILEQSSWFHSHSVTDNLINYIDTTTEPSRTPMVAYAYQLLGKVGLGDESVKQYLLDKSKTSYLPVRSLIENFPDDEAKQTVILNLEQQIYAAERNQKDRILRELRIWGGEEAAPALKRILEHELGKGNDRNIYVITDIQNALKRFEQTKLDN